MLSDVEKMACDAVNGGICAEEETDGAKAVRLTLRTEDKLKNKSDFDVVKEKGRKYQSNFFTLLVLFETEENLLERAKCGVICSRKFHKRAVVRNRARRIIFESFRLLKPEIRPCRMIFIPRKAIQTADMNAVKSRIESIAAIFKSPAGTAFQK